MKTKFFISFPVIFLLAVHISFSQSKETIAKYQKVDQPAFTIIYDQPSDMVTGAVQQRLKKDGISFRTGKGVISCKGVNYPVLADTSVNLYFLVEGRGRKGRDGSDLTLFISKGPDHFISRQSDPHIAKKALQYLNELQQNVTVYALQQQINAQQKTVDGKAKDYRKLLKASHKLESKRYGLQKKLSSETNPSRQDKLRNKIQSLNKKISRNQSDIKGNQRDLLQAKDQLNFLQQQLSQQTIQGK